MENFEISELLTYLIFYISILKVSTKSILGYLVSELFGISIIVFTASLSLSLGKVQSVT